jgi:hypothetical protein
MVYEYKLLPVQKALLNSSKPMAGIYSGRGVGKTYILSIMITMAILKGEKSLCFSQNFKSLSQNLFEEVIQRFNELGIVPNYSKGAMVISYNGGKALGFTYCSPDACRGQTRCHNLFLDEAALMPNDLMAIAAPCLRGEGIKPKIRFCSTPRMGCNFNTLVRENMNNGKWDVFTAVMRDNKFLSEESLEMAEQAITDPLMRRQELYGEILDNVIENCIVNINDFSTVCTSNGGRIICGIDFARFGVDCTCFTIRDDYEILEQVKLNGADTAKICSEFRRLDNKYHFDAVYEDATGGFNIGFHDTMKVTHNNLNEINFGGKPLNPQDANTRTSMYFNLASAIQNGFYINERKYKDLFEEIKNTSYIINNAGKRALIPKADIKEILGRSPDSCDSLALTFCDLASNQITREECHRLCQTLFR